MVLPQGMANSPTICQIYVSLALAPVQKAFPGVYIIHYMDDILMAAKDKNLVFDAFSYLQEVLSLANLQIAPKKVQVSFPYHYLGHELLRTGIRPQKITLRMDQLRTLNDFQTFLGDIQWLRPTLKIPTGQLRPLYDVLKGDPDPSTPRKLTAKGRVALQRVQEALEQAHVQYIDLNSPLLYLIFCFTHSPTRVF